MTEPLKLEMPHIYASPVFFMGGNPQQMGACDSEDVRQLVDCANEELDKLRAERNAAVRLSGCECGPRELCENLVALHAEVAKAREERDAALARVKELEGALASFEMALAPENGLGESLTGCAMRVVQDLGHYRSSVQELTEWRPMETAPRDGTRVLCMTKKGQTVRDLSWSDDCGGLWSGEPLCYADEQIMAWLPLPEPPKDGAV